MPEARVAVGARVGLHARPAAQFVQLSSSQPCQVRIGRPGQQLVNAKSILAVLQLAVGHGEEVLVATEGKEADEALEQIVALLGSDLDEQG